MVWGGGGATLIVCGGGATGGGSLVGTGGGRRGPGASGISAPPGKAAIIDATSVPCGRSRTAVTAAHHVVAAGNQVR